LSDWTHTKCLFKPYRICSVQRWDRWSLNTKISLANQPFSVFHDIGHWVVPISKYEGESNENLKSAKKKIKNLLWIFLKRNPGISEALEDMHWMRQRLRWKMTKLYQTYLQYTSCEQNFKGFHLTRPRTISWFSQQSYNLSQVSPCFIHFLYQSLFIDNWVAASLNTLRRSHDWMSHVTSGGQPNK
jgi:hypothetical protein